MMGGGACGALRDGDVPGVSIGHPSLVLQPCAPETSATHLMSWQRCGEAAGQASVDTRSRGPLPLPLPPLAPVTAPVANELKMEESRAAGAPPPVGHEATLATHRPSAVHLIGSSLVHPFSTLHAPSAEAHSPLVAHLTGRASGHVTSFGHSLLTRDKR